MNHDDSLAQKFVHSPLWFEALWCATTFQWHPTSQMPPLMGVVFANWTKGIELFNLWVNAVGNGDEDDDLRVAILLGNVGQQRPGYSIRISDADYEFLEQDDPDRASLEAIGRVQRMHPPAEEIDGEFVPFGHPKHSGGMVTKFIAEYEKHGEFMLAPAVQRDDDQLYLNPQKGIIKRELVIRQVSEIEVGEPDMIAQRQCDVAELAAQAIEVIDQAMTEQGGNEGAPPNA